MPAMFCASELRALRLRFSKALCITSVPRMVMMDRAPIISIKVKARLRRSAEPWIKKMFIARLSSDHLTALIKEMIGR